MADKIIISRSIRFSKEVRETFGLDPAVWAVAVYSDIPGGGYSQAVICGLKPDHAHDIAPWVKNHVADPSKPGAITILV